MKDKQILVAFLLGVSLCFMPTLGYGEIAHRAYDVPTSYMDFMLLDARISYIIQNPTSFLGVDIWYDPEGGRRKLLEFPDSIDTKGKILIVIVDTRSVFSYKPRMALLDEFKRNLEPIYSFTAAIATSMDTDIVGQFRTKEGIPLGYFYQGKYHLWEE